MTTMRVVGECFFWYRLTRVFPDKFHRAVKRLCVCVCEFIDKAIKIILQQTLIMCYCLQCFYTVGWVAGRASVLYKPEWWGAGMVICLGRGADLHMAQLMPLPLTISCSSKSRLVLPFWHRLTQVGRKTVVVLV